MRRVRDLVLAASLACACVFLPAASQAAQSVTLRATLTPERLGQGTTIGFSFHIAGPNGELPPPLTAVQLSYPENLGIATSGLGLETCGIEHVEAFGATNCPSESVMGSGSALAEIPVGPLIVHELAPVTIFRAPDKNGQIGLLLYADGLNPVDAEILLPSLLLPAPAPFGGSVQIAVPLVPSLPDSPYVAVVQLTTTLGPLGITYYERIHGHSVAYHPRGLLLPDRCPRGGFPFAVQLKFLDGSSATARTAVPCPSGAQHRRARA